MAARRDDPVSLRELAEVSARDSSLTPFDRARWLVQGLRCRGCEMGAQARWSWVATRQPLDTESRALWRELRAEVHQVLLAEQGNQPRAFGDPSSGLVHDLV